MLEFLCPVCNNPLALVENTYKCKNNHCFDRSKKGYVNLLSCKGGKLHGDDKTMVNARTRFLDGGFYEDFRDEVCKMVVKYSPEGCKIIDCGCGECYYTAEIFRQLELEGKRPEIMGIDISKDAISAGFRRCKGLSLAVGSVFHLPCKSENFDILVTLFSPFCKEEYTRVLKKGGHLIMAIPLENHLWELKCEIYEKPYKNQVGSFEIEGFELVEKSEIKNRISLTSNQQVLDLFSMTPYYYKTSHEDREKLNTVDRLEVQTEFMVLVYKKI